MSGESIKMKENTVYNKNQLIQVEITDMGTEGEGIGKKGILILHTVKMVISRYRFAMHLENRLH